MTRKGPITSRPLFVTTCDVLHSFFVRTTHPRFHQVMLQLFGKGGPKWCSFYHRFHLNRFTFSYQGFGGYTRGCSLQVKSAFYYNLLATSNHKVRFFVSMNNLHDCKPTNSIRSSVGLISAVKRYLIQSIMTSISYSFCLIIFTFQLPGKECGAIISGFRLPQEIPILYRPFSEKVYFKIALCVYVISTTKKLLESKILHFDSVPGECNLANKIT